MSSNRSVLAIVFGVLILLITVELLRRRQLREKYAALWIVISGLTLVVAVFPALLVRTADRLGFGLPANLVFFIGGTVLLVISMQLSFETGRLESETQRLAEEHALLQFEVARLRRQVEALSRELPPAARPQLQDPSER
jgi:hypothetical protein